MKKLKLVLHGYLPQSPNRLYGRHWSMMLKERKKAKDALISALSSVYHSTDANSWTRTTAQRALSSLLTNSGAGLIPDDRPQDIRLEIEQIKVRHKAEQKTEIELTFF